ncbi:uncharacterized protein LOC111706586 isoform X2 [Eurytemora carolleeae]|uniref:uncharacterized protein LOC111706586 isoform X2 n=1 Tax=Eurytemora carolleeae TaxID=1294199 RepID=UPI000C78CDB3|nr:uncharacterized protein LOC111706586 isoform X2 [Eurytemora carolleeae]|eukprot:XP_023335265.1 uncharacterized protein LOC111706586 isoform X2 [Eurytemora affinis]
MFTVLLILMLVWRGEGVPSQYPTKCFFPRVWRDLWDNPTKNISISILAENWDALGKCVLELDEANGIRPYVVHEKNKKCYVCLQVQQLHPNVLRLKSSECRKEKEVNRLCYGEITQQKWSYLYRHAAPQKPCPDLLEGSHAFSYSEYAGISDTYIQGCGEPRSEINHCNQRNEDDPQLSLNFGNCPEGVLVHRTAMTQTMKCIGNWVTPSGVTYIIGTGEIWEFWEPGDYRNAEHQYVCMALETDGLKIYLSQGFGAGCDGFGGELSPRNGLRNLVLEKTIRLEENCEFPAWVQSSPTWQIIPQGGMRLNEQGPRLVEITSSGSFRLGVGDGTGQTFSCAKVLKSTKDEVMLQTFSQSQCYGEYHCFHALLSSSTGTIKLHVGAPSPNIEHSCVIPSFDPDVPFMMATIIPANNSSKEASVDSNFGKEDSSDTTEEFPHPSLVWRDRGSADVSGDTLDQIEKETRAQLYTISKQFTQHISTLMGDFMRRVLSS